MNQDFIISNWHVWPPMGSDDDELGENQKELLATVPKMLKRRLSPLAKIVFCAASPCLQEKKRIPIVFSSTHGELAKSFEMMEMIQAGEDISPTAFSLSVHNAIAGLFAMYFDNNCETTVVAPGEEGIAGAFIEACGILQEGEDEVLVVFYDEPLVSFYPSDPFQLSTDQSCAVALLISRSGSGMPVRLRCLPQTGDDGEQPMQLPLLIHFLSETGEKLTIHTARHSWSWEKSQ